MFKHYLFPLAKLDNGSLKSINFNLFELFELLFASLKVLDGSIGKTGHLQIVYHFWLIGDFSIVLWKRNTDGEAIRY